LWVSTCAKEIWEGGEEGEEGEKRGRARERNNSKSGELGAREERGEGGCTEIRSSFFRI
jgi:hypothetical protein